MKTLPLILLTFVLCFTCPDTYAVRSPRLLAQRTTSPPLKSPREVLFDFRVERKSAPMRIPRETQKNVLSKVFRKYLTDENKCNPNFEARNATDPLLAARNAGQIVPSIVDMATGSFTAPGQTETLYVISVSECNASHADNFGTKRVAIFAGPKLIADNDADFNSNIVRKTDLNGDGMDELLMTGGDVNQGIVVEIAALLEFKGGSVRVIEDLGTVSEDSCGSGIGGSSSKASVISLSQVVAGRMPRLRIDNYEAGCRKPERWRFVSTGKMSGAVARPLGRALRAAVPTGAVARPLGRALRAAVNQFRSGPLATAQCSPV